MDRVGELFNEICKMILMLVYIQVLWVVFTLLGLIIFGFGPATYAMFTVMRQWVRGNKDLPIFKTYFNAYRSGFKESLGAGLFYLACGMILYVDLIYVQSQALKGLLMVICFLYAVSLFYIFPILVHYDWKSPVLKVKCSVLFGLSYLQYTLTLFAALGAVYYLLYHVPGVLTFFGISIGSYMTMWMANQVFKRIEIQAGIHDVKVNDSLIKGGGKV
ncbi:YesL family protein [Mesobacillus foraminis]|uniref:Putative membrane protein YesL n=1 Tax=Mesobacillus foraminis TaxID=279826 RepID=A0A4R2BAZ4_9BACI|nr:YesL family protein [Mesobacillus foraminis]TCN22714.1 putative membrane protein YesL [Mesobacillus foraminis]